MLGDVLQADVLAPDFTLLDEQERRIRLGDLRKTWVVLWWFPKASTSG
jgi:peroxiredoxin